MRRSTVFALACVLPLACGKLLDIEEPNRIGDEQGGSSGAAGDGGDDGRGGTAGTAKGGASGSAAQSGTAGATTQGGADGNGAQSGAAGATTEGGAAGNSMGGQGGEGGDPGPMLGGPCDDQGLVSCTPADQRLILICGQDVDEPLTWRFLRRCDNDLACTASVSPQGPDCYQPAEQCSELDGSYCRRDGTLEDCSDPFHYLRRRCPFGCEGGRCTVSGDQLVVHTEEEPTGGDVPWPRSIPVCFVAPGDEILSARLREEVEHSLARYLDVEFSGFGQCPSGVAEVAIEFLDDCRERLGSSYFLSGYPEDGEESRVGICASYFDAAGNRQKMVDHEALFRFAVRHQFGHVLGRWCDSNTHADDAMVRGLDEPRAAEKVFSDDTLVGGVYPGQITAPRRSLADQYGRKPTGSLVTPSGYCLTASGAAIGPRACSSSGRFGLEECVNVHGIGTPVTPGTCGSASTAVSFARARWSTPSLCIAPRGQSAGSSIEATACEPVGDASQAWHFEIISRDAEKLSARIRPSATGLCLTAPNTPVVTGDIPTLQACEPSKSEQTFSLWPNGKISLGPELVGERAGRCLTHEQPRGVVSFFPCVWETLDARVARRFFLSGPLETPNGALRLAPNDANAVLTLSSPLGDDLPTADQIFDFTF